MEPILLVCGGCGVRIRTSDPEKARQRDCPRCAWPLAPSVDQILGIEPALGGQVDLKAPPAVRRRTTAAVSILVTIGSLASLVVREASPRSDASPPTTLARIDPVPIKPIIAVQPAGSPTTDPAMVEAEETNDVALPDLSTPPPPPNRALAILDRAGQDLIVSPARPLDARSRPDRLDLSTPAPPLPAESAGSITGLPVPIVSHAPRHLLVRDSKGRAIVAREYGKLKDRPAAILPDGQIGWPESLVVTRDPFVLATMDEMERDLKADAEFAGFKIITSAHYLVAYKSSETFARASAELLEKLHDGLTGTLRRLGLPIDRMEFPLVAVIFDSEQEFRASRRVAPDIQAYYEILSNRIFFYETSSRDQDAPEVSALRKPQTVAHEGTHQILHNVGVQPRLSDWPLWLVEGLAEYCSSTRFTKKGVEWAGLGQINPIHLATIRDLDDPLPNQFHGDRREAVVLRDRGTPLVEYLATRKELTPTDYALSWALTHYLANQRLDDLVAYIKQMSRLAPFSEQSPADQLAAFRAAFGGDLAQMDGKVGKYLKKFKPSDALPHYAVIFEQAVGPTAIRRHYMVSQSPSVIRQWIDSVTAPEGGQPHWRVHPHLSQKKALEAAEQWMNGGH